MKTMSRLMLIACLVLPVLVGCKKEDASQAQVKAPMSAPATDDRQAWVDYLNDVVPRNMAGIANQPYVYLLPGTSAPDFQEQYNRLVEKAQSDVARGIIHRNWDAYLGELDQAAPDAKSVLQEWVQGKQLPLPRYVEIGREGPDHAPRFRVAVSIGKLAEAEGEGASKQAAEKIAAATLLARLAEEDRT